MFILFCESVSTLFVSISALLLSSFFLLLVSICYLLVIIFTCIKLFLVIRLSVLFQRSDFT